MGVCKLEAGFLSGEARVCKIPESLRVAPQHRGSELYVPALSNREVAAWLDRSHARGLSVRHQGAPENHTRRPAARRRGIHFGFSALASTARRRKEIGPGALPVAALFEVRCCSAAGFSRSAA